MYSPHFWCLNPQKKSMGASLMTPDPQAQTVAGAGGLATFLASQTVRMS